MILRSLRSGIQTRTTEDTDGNSSKATLVASAATAGRPNISDGKYYRVGTTFTDTGRSAITGDKRAFYAFRTPGLRHVAQAYMHDEFLLAGAPSVTPDVQPLDIEPLLGLSYSEISAIVAFLESLSEVSPPDHEAHAALKARPKPTTSTCNSPQHFDPRTSPAWNPLRCLAQEIYFFVLRGSSEGLT